MSSPAAADTEFTGYRPDIDGLRAIAVLAVVFYHAFPKKFPGGFVGVDVFFVISGFLISGNIFSNLDTGKFSFWDFYGRRIRRIFPALFLVLLSCLCYGFVVLLPSELAQLGKNTAAGAGFLSNILLWHEAGYFDSAAATKPLLHLWSLGVEEHFYIFWPFTLWILYRANISRTGFFVAATLASLGLNIAFSLSDPTADFYSPFTRFWELSAGAMLAWLTLHPSHRLEIKIAGRNRSLPGILSLAGLALIIGSIFGLNSQMPFPGWLALLPVAGAAILIAAGPPALVNRYVLSNRVAVFIGLISYPLYLWHWPLISYSYILNFGRPPKPFLATILVAISFVLAWLTYILAEKPLRFGSHKRKKTITLVAAVAVIGVSGAVIWAENGFAARYANLTNVNVLKINAAISDGVFKPTADMRVQNIRNTLITVIGHGDEAILFTGDSVLFQYGPRVQQLFAEGRLKKTVYFVAGASCAPLPGIIKTGYFAHCSEMPAIATDLIAKQHIGTVVIGALWAGYRGDSIYVERAGQRMEINSPAAVDDFYANLEDEVRNLIQTGHKVYLILSVPADNRFDPKQMVRRSFAGISLDPQALSGAPLADVLSGAEGSNQRLLGIAKRTGAMTLNPVPDICGAGPVCSSFFGNGEPKFADTMHLRPIFVKDNITFLDNLLTH